jgi:recombinational DNA repair protein RecR
MALEVITISCNHRDESKYQCTNQDYFCIMIASSLVFFLVLQTDPLDNRLAVEQPENSFTQQDEKASTSDHECLICKDNKRIYAMVPCGHLIACASCKLLLGTNPCPLCNKAHRKWLRIFY